MMSGLLLQMERLGGISCFYFLTETRGARNVFAFEFLTNFMCGFRNSLV